MCVLARALDNPKLLQVYVKGAPEKVKDLCRPDTGSQGYFYLMHITHVNSCYAVPMNFREVLRSLTQKGLRVLAVAHRSMDMQWHKSENIERLVGGA